MRINFLFAFQFRSAVDVSLSLFLSLCLIHTLAHTLASPLSLCEWVSARFCVCARETPKHQLSSRSKINYRKTYSDSIFEARVILLYIYLLIWFVCWMCNMRNGTKYDSISNLLFYNWTENCFRSFAIHPSAPNLFATVRPLRRHFLIPIRRFVSFRYFSAMAPLHPSISLGGNAHDISHLLCPDCADDCQKKNQIHIIRAVWGETSNKLTVLPKYGWEKDR